MFQQNRKILPNIFDVWMNILNKHVDVYLALCISNEKIINNIKNYCEENNFDFVRIIFLKSINHKENLIRISNFDMYLDTILTMVTQAYLTVYFSLVYQLYHLLVSHLQAECHTVPEVIKIKKTCNIQRKRLFR